MLPVASPLGGAGLHLVRSLVPALGTALRSCVINRALVTATVTAAAQPQPAENTGSFGESLPSHDGVDLSHTHHSGQRFVNVLSHVRSQYPEEVWSKLVGLFPEKKQRPVAIDIAVGYEGRAGVELAKRGFQVVSVSSDADILRQTLAYAAASNAQLELVTAHSERDVVHSDSADLVTCMHGLHLLEYSQALPEAHRILKHGGKLVVAWNDRDLSDGFVGELERVIERHVPDYSRSAPTRQHYIHAWTPTLQEAGLFRLTEYHEHHNPITLEGPDMLTNILDSQSFVRHTLHGPRRQALHSEVRELAEKHFGSGPLVLPMQTRMFILDKAYPSKLTFAEMLERRRQAKKKRQAAQ